MDIYEQRKKCADKLLGISAALGTVAAQSAYNCGLSNVGTVLSSVAAITFGLASLDIRPYPNQTER